MADMGFMTRDNMAKNNLQVLTTFDWDFEIDWHQAAMYHPADEIFRIRSTQVSGISAIPPISNIDIPLRGFHLLQPGLSENKPQPITLQAQDFEDQALAAFLYDWVNKCSNIETRVSYRKQDLIIDMTFYQLNSSHTRVASFKYFSCLPASPTVSYDMTSAKDASGATSIVVESEFMLPTLLNVS